MSGAMWAYLGIVYVSLAVTISVAVMDYHPWPVAKRRRIASLAPIWPLALPAALVYGLCWIVGWYINVWSPER